MGIPADLAATAYGPARGNVKGDQSTTGTVEYLDLSAWKGCWVRIVAITEPIKFVFVESTTPATTPTLTSVTGDSAMAYLPAEQAIERVVPPDNPVLAYASASSNTGAMRVSRDGGGTQ